MTVPNFNNGAVFTNEPNDKNFAYAGEEFIFLGVEETDYEEIEEELDEDIPFQLYIDGYDPKGVLKKHEPRPADGLYLKMEDFDEPRDFDVKDIANGCGVIDERKYIFKPTPLTGNTLYSGDPELEQYGAPPEAAGDPEFSDITEANEKTPVKLMVINRNLIEEFVSICLVTVYYVHLDPIPKPKSNGEAVTIKLSFRPFYNHTWGSYTRCWRVRIDQDGFNTLLTKAEYKALKYGS